MNQDTWLHFGLREVSVGVEVMQMLQLQELFGDCEFVNSEDVRHLVRDGHLAFVVLLAPDFSR